MMQPCFHIEIVTPKKVVLDGLWYGPYSAKASKGKPKKPKRVIVWVHGLGSSMFSKLEIADELVDKETAVVMFNNRGHDKVTSVRRTNGAYVRAGAVHEVFTDCVDDIQGAINFAKKQGVKDVYLAGHSTGCQKAVYWASKKGRGVKGVIILAPMSDYETELAAQGKKVIQRAAAQARAYMKKGKKHVMLPEDIWRWPWIADAQRFLSLYTGASAEEIFTYWDTSKSPRTLKSVRIPLLVLLAEKEEFSHIPAKQIAAWFETHIRKGRAVIVPKVGHSFSSGGGSASGGNGGEKMVAAHIRSFIGLTQV